MTRVNPRPPAAADPSLLRRIEEADRETMFCSTCGAPTIVAERDGRLWLECSSVGARGRLRSILTFDLGIFHSRRPIGASGRSRAA